MAAVVNKKYDYRQFREAVKQRLASNLACFKLTPDQLEDYISEEEDQIRSEFRGYQRNLETANGQNEDQRFYAGVCGVAYCLEMCY